MFLWTTARGVKAAPRRAHLQLIFYVFILAPAAGSLCAFAIDCAIASKPLRPAGGSWSPSPRVRDFPADVQQGIALAAARAHRMIRAGQGDAGGIMLMQAGFARALLQPNQQRGVGSSPNYLLREALTCLNANNAASLRRILAVLYPNWRPGNGIGPRSSQQGRRPGQGAE